jgi:SAM-dependent methyltransferase
MILNPDGSIYSIYNGETGKAHTRRLKEGWFEKYAPSDKIGLDIGCGPDPLNYTFRRFDIVFGDGDATLLPGLPSDTYWTVYASHILEHLDYPRAAINRWYNVLKSGGHLIITVPHRDLYEKKLELPSQWNPDHKHFWLPDEEDLPHTRSLKKEVLAVIPNANIVDLRVISNLLSSPAEGLLENAEICYPTGEYSIEIIVKKDSNRI